MNLTEIFDSLLIPERGNDSVFNSTRIPEYPNFRIATDILGNPTLLLSAPTRPENITLKNFRLKHLRLLHNVNCKIIDENEINFQSFTVITFTSSDRNSRKYFLKVAESFIKSLDANTTQKEIAETLNKFIEIFRSLTDLPTKTAQGLWAELFLIDNAKEPKTMVNYWHNIPENKFDFDSGLEKIEVKSNAGFKRIHSFSSEQLNPVEDCKVLIASVFVHQSSSGNTIPQLVDRISEKLDDDVKLIEKLNQLVTRTLGNSFEQSMDIGFDYEVAKNSLKLYKSEDVKKILNINIPTEVSNVSYKSDLTLVDHVNPTSIEPKSSLFSGL